MLNQLHTGPPSPDVPGGASVSVAVGGRAVNPPSSQESVSEKILAEYMEDPSAETIHIPSGNTSSCPNVAWGMPPRKPPRPSSGVGLREEVMRRRHADWRYGPPVLPKNKTRTPGVGKAKDKRLLKRRSSQWDKTMMCVGLCGEWVSICE